MKFNVFQKACWDFRKNICSLGHPVSPDYPIFLFLLWKVWKVALAPSILGSSSTESWLLSIFSQWLIKIEYFSLLIRGWRSSSLQCILASWHHHKTVFFYVIVILFWSTPISTNWHHNGLVPSRNSSDTDSTRWCEFCSIAFCFLISMRCISFCKILMSL